MIAFISAGASHAKNIFVFQVFKLDDHFSIHLIVLILCLLVKLDICILHLVDDYCYILLEIVIYC